MKEVQFRHEYKHYLNYGDYLTMQSRLRAVMKPDNHVSKEGMYLIRSLYFDNASDKALREKLDGVRDREKFRIRCYNMDFSFIRLEKKVKRGGVGYKISDALSIEETRKILQGDIQWMQQSDRALVTELYTKMKYDGLKPKTVIDYKREPFIYPAGNVRVTLDYDIRTSGNGVDLLDEKLPMVATNPGTVILEVKYDNFLPDVIRDIVQLRYREEGAFSKYASGRQFL